MLSPRSEPGAPDEGEVARPFSVDPAALSECLASLGHDLRSPLGVVSETLAELRSDFAAQLTDEHRLLVTLAERGLRRIGRIADTVTLVAALDSGSFSLRRHPVDLVELVRAATATAVTLEPRREVTLTSELPEALCRGTADEVRLPHAVSELVINAIRHARGHVRVHLDLAAGVMHVAIEDDGQGLTDAARATVFRRYVVRGSRSGLGIGLSIAHDVIVAHGGAVTLEASTLPPGRVGTIGARFVVTLPVVVEA